MKLRKKVEQKFNYLVYIFFLIRGFAPLFLKVEYKGMSFQKIKKAIEQHKLNAVKKLVEADPAIIHIQNSNGVTPLFIAFHEQQLDIAKYLIDSGADINHKSTKDGWTVLHIACYLVNLEIVNLLLNYYIDIEATTNTGATPLYLVCKTGAAHMEAAIDIIKALLLADIGDDEEDKYINRKEEHGYFPLYIASKNGDEDIVELLIDRGANVSERTEQGVTALNIAIQENYEKSHLEVIKTLLLNGAYNDDVADATGHTVLYWAQQNGDTEVIELLMQYEPDSPTPTSSTKSSIFTIDSFEPTELDIITINKSQIPETAEDIINIEDVNIVDFLAESDQNRIIKVHNSFYAVNGEDIKSHYLTGNQKKNYIYYPCKQALPPPALGVGKKDVYMNKPLFSASYLVGVLSDFILLSEVNAMFESGNKFFEIVSGEFENIPATATAQMFTANPNAVSANHCQEGKEAKIIKLKMINIVDESNVEAKAEAVAKGTKKRKTANKKRKTAKKRKTVKRRK